MEAGLMKLRMSFQTEPGREEGYSIDLAENTTLEPFDVTVRGVDVHITPSYGGGFIFAGAKVHASLYSISAVVELPYDGPLEFDERNGNLIVTRELYERGHGPAFEALQRTMMHLRAVTDDPHIDHYLSTLVLAKISDEKGKDLYTHDDDPDWQFYSSDYELTRDNWGSVAAKVQGAEVPNIEQDLLLNARAFLQYNNYSMALINAAMACEMSLHRVIRPRLVTGDVAPGDAEKFTDRLPVPKLLTLLRFLGLALPAQCESIQTTYTARNKLVHGEWPPSVITSAQAQTAIAAATFLQSL
jgi:hypothetical protein